MSANKKKKRQKEEKVSIDDILSVITGETLVEEKLEKVHAVLKDLLEMNTDIKGAMLVSIEGFPIACHPPEIFREEAKVAAAIAAIFATSERNALDLVDEHVSYVAIKTFNRYIILKLAAEDYIIAVITDEKARLGILLRDIGKATSRIKDILAM